MIKREDYYQNYQKAESLAKKLKERIFLKTDLDIVYSDIVNWERHGLLDIGGDSKKGEWKKLNYIEYVWLCIVSDLRGFGFNYLEIIEVKKLLAEQITVGEVIKAVELSPEKRNQIEALDQDNILNNFLPSHYDIELYSILETLLMTEIIESNPTSVLISKDIPGLVVPISKEILNGLIKIDSIGVLDTLFDGNICSISLSKIASKFFVKTENNFSNYLTSILSDNEKRLLKIIRKQSQNIKRITVIINEGEMDRIEVTSVKKVQLESRLLEHIKKGDYQKITIDTMDGNIVNFENTEKIKL